MNPPEQFETVEKNDAKDTQATDISSSLWDDMKKSIGDVGKAAVSGMLPGGSLDFSDDIFNNHFDKLIAQSGPLPAGDTSPSNVPGKEKVQGGEVQPTDAPGKEKVPTGEVQPDSKEKRFDPKDAVNANATEGDTKPFNPDDYQVVDLEDGTKILNEPDGTISIKSPDGTFVQYKPDGSKYTQNPDGSSVMEDSEGNKWIKDSNGKMHSEHVSLIGKIWDLIPTF